MPHSTLQSHPNPRVGFCCSGSILDMLPLSDIMRTLSTQHLPASQRSEIYVLPPSSARTSEFQHIIRSCGWFVVVYAFNTPSLSSTTYFTKAMIGNAPSCLQLTEPWDCGVAWQKVEKLHHLLQCSTTGRMFEAEVWAGPALLNAEMLVGEAVQDEATGETFLTGSGFGGRPR
ncbi:hypothetical protein N431DRAFT_464094 [Stipitochalara longipes BDJ]|nr:hypothetical protein N431DRAFT_464094 [Stipitochalara longipes BDJ]